LWTSQRSIISHIGMEDSKQIQNVTIWEPPPLGYIPENVKSSVSKEIINSVRVAGQTIVLDKTELKSVQARVGGTIGHRGDAGNSLEWLCLRGDDALGPWVLWLMSGENNHGSVGGICWERSDCTAQFDARCQSLPRVAGTIELPLVVRLGMSESEVLRILGQPSDRNGDTLLYLHRREMGTGNQVFTAMNTVRVVLRKQVARAIEVWKSTTD
jgi:hypothetical protein